ncbi:MAG: hypothetical protein AAFY11_16110 [Cyanobacteria bacterium J06641_5]
MFEWPEAVDTEWIETLVEGARSLATRHAVFSFLAGYWRQDWRAAIAAVSVPTLVAMGKGASSISRASTPRETPEERLELYCNLLPNGRGVLLPGRNVLPYEEPTAFATACWEFTSGLGSR